jgi:hypothetical protein
LFPKTACARWRVTLIALGSQTQVPKLQGYLFFCAAHTLLENVRGHVGDAKGVAPRFEILNFE